MTKHGFRLRPVLSPLLDVPALGTVAPDRLQHIHQAGLLALDCERELDMTGQLRVSLKKRVARIETLIA